MSDHVDEFTELLGAYALDAVDDDEREAIEAHLLSCPRCRAEVAEHREVAAFLSKGAPAPDGVWDRIAAELSPPAPPLRMTFSPDGDVDPLATGAGTDSGDPGDTADVLPLAPPATRRGRSRRTWIITAAAAAAAGPRPAPRPGGRGGGGGRGITPAGAAGVIAPVLPGAGVARLDRRSAPSTQSWADGVVSNAALQVRLKGKDTTARAAVDR